MTGASGASAASDRPPAPEGDRRRPGSLLHLFALSGLVVAQPLLDLLGRQPEFFAIRRFTPAGIVGLALALVFLVPLPLAALVAAARLLPNRGRAVHLAAIGSLLALLALLALHRTALDGWPWLVTGVLAGALATVLYARLDWLRQLVGLCGIGLILFPAVFLLTPGIRRQLTAESRHDSVPPSGARTPIVLLVADELTTTDLLDDQGRIDGRAFPNLARLASEATWFENALTISDSTELAVPALLSGVVPSMDLLPTARDYPHNLFAALPDYRIWASEPITRLYDRGEPEPPAERELTLLASDLWIVYRHLLLPRSWRAGLPALGGQWTGFGRGADGAPSAGRPSDDDLAALHRDRASEIDRMISAIDAEREAALYFLHVLLPHRPWEFLPSGRRYLTPPNFVPGLRENEFWVERESYVIEAYQRYYLQAQYLDRRIGDLVRRLRETGLYDRALIAFVADHGTSFRAGESRRAYTPLVEPDILPVPLIIKRPGQRRGEIVSRRVSTLDLTPTILAEIGARPPWPLERRSLFADPPQPAPDYVATRHKGRVPVAADLDRRVSERSAWIRARFELVGDPPARLVIRRPAGSPVGRPVAVLARGAGDAGRARLDARVLPAGAEPGAGFVPAWIGGEVDPEGSGPDCCELAVALGGRIVATTRVEAAGEDRRFGVLVPEWDLGTGPGEIELLRVDAGEPPRLVPFRVEGGGTPAELVLDEAGRSRAVRRAGGEIPLRPDSAKGFFEVRADGALTFATGWAFDAEQKAEPHEILVFQGTRLVASGSISGVRKDVIAALRIPDPGFRTEFEIPIATGLIPDLEATGLRLVALGGAGAAAELGYFRRLRSGPDGRPASVDFSDGRRFAIVDGGLEGALIDVREDEHGTEFTGWAWDRELGAGPERVLAFDGEHAAFDGAPFTVSPKLASRLDLPRRARLRFRFRVPGRRDETSARPLVVVAIGPGRRARVLGR